jgi:hypothetical protein
MMGGKPPIFFMEKDKLKKIISKLKLIVDELESEVYSDPQAYKYDTQYDVPLSDYDEVFNDDDGYPD